MWKKISSQFYSLLQMFFIFQLKHVLGKVGGKVVKCVNYTKCLVAFFPGVAPNAQNRSLKNRSWIQILYTALSVEQCNNLLV